MLTFMRFYIYVILFSLTLFSKVFAYETPPTKQQPATAIFVINNAGVEYDQFIPTLKDNLTTLLTQKGFSIVRTENTVLPVGLPDSNENKITDPQVEASLSHLAELLKAELLVVSTINSITHDEAIFDGTNTIYKSSNKVATESVRINLQVFDVGSTKSVYGDSVSSSIRKSINTDNTNNRSVLINLFYDAAEKVAGNITSHVSMINASATTPKNIVSFTISCNVTSVDVFLDGVVIGTTGKKTSFVATPGLHQLKLGKNLLKSWEKTVNIIDGASYSINLDLNNEGIARYKNIEAFNLALRAGNSFIDIAKEQSNANAKATVEISKGERAKRESSYIKDDGFVDNLKKVIHGD